jgi:uncharacterized membrane protein
MKATYCISCIVAMIIIVSFLGFMVENVWLAFTKGYIDNRNMGLPFLLGYGIAIIGIYMLLGTPQHSRTMDRITFLDTSLKRIVFYFLCAFMFVCIAEILLGTFIEKTCHIVLWNYSRFTLHITKYTSIPTSNGFAFIITFFMDKCFTPIMNLLSQIECIVSQKVSFVIFGLMVFDFAINSIKMFKNKSLNPIWKVTLKHYDELEETIPN